MGVDDARGGTPPLAGDGPARWLEVQEALLRGLAHALGNRVGMVAGVADLLGVSAAPSPRMIAALQEEAGRLEALLRRLRGVPRPGGAAEPVVLAEALAEAEGETPVRTTQLLDGLSPALRRARRAVRPWW